MKGLNYTYNRYNIVFYQCQVYRVHIRLLSKKNVGIDTTWRHNFTSVFLRAPIKIRKWQQNSMSITSKIVLSTCAPRNSWWQIGNLCFNRGHTCKLIMLKFAKKHKITFLNLLIFNDLKK